MAIKKFWRLVLDIICFLCISILFNITRTLKNLVILTALLVVGCGDVSVGAQYLENTCGSNSIKGVIEVAYESFVNKPEVDQVFIKVKNSYGEYHLDSLAFYSAKNPYIDIWIMPRPYSDYFDRIFNNTRNENIDGFSYSVISVDKRWLTGGRCIQASYVNGSSFRNSVIELKN